jgi:hypothetical protein
MRTHLLSNPLQGIQNEVYYFGASSRRSYFSSDAK